MRPHARRILQYVAAFGPVSCNAIAVALGMNRQAVYRFLYKAIYSNGWVDNIKPIPAVGDPNYTAANFIAPGQYVVTAKGQNALVEATD
jgi:hypothetical protein